MTEFPPEKPKDFNITPIEINDIHTYSEENIDTNIWKQIISFPKLHIALLILGVLFNLILPGNNFYK